jgi:S-disulfanyl-L-cysteine oxidoreductase SoxD
MTDKIVTRKMMRTGFLLLAGAALGVALVPLRTNAQAKQSVWDGIYTDAQADRGKGQYAQHCAVCHGIALEGNGESPPLTGEFIPDWGGTTLADLYDKIENTMPLNAPGTLRPAVATEILAYLLKENNFPAAQKELDATPSELGAIRFDVLKPTPAATSRERQR